MKQFWFQVAALLIIIFGAMIMSVNQGMLKPIQSNLFSNQSGPQPQGRQLVILDAVSDPAAPLVKALVNVEVADNAEMRAKGLGGRELLEWESGMLFVFSESVKPRFWMKGMKFPIDIIWISGDRIVDILSQVPPALPDTADEALPKYGPVVSVDKALEVNSGFAQKQQIRVGDKVQLITE